MNISSLIGPVLLFDLEFKNVVKNGDKLSKRFCCVSYLKRFLCSFIFSLLLNANLLSA